MRILIGKVNADFMETTKASIEIELARKPMTFMYELAIRSFRNVVNQKFPPQMGVPTRHVRWQVNELKRNQNYRRNQNWVKRTRTDSSIITLTDGQQIEYHPSFQFST